jgi:uncharacterized lipoprotein YajG
MKFRSTLILAAVLSTLLFAGCKKPPEPSESPPAPAPSAGSDQGPGTTTNFENPAPAEPAKPAG